MTYDIHACKKPHLSDVTLCCVDCAQPELAMRAMRESQEQCDFAESILLTDWDIDEKGIAVRRIQPIRNAASYSHFVLKKLSGHITTPFVLLIQWDGYVIAGDCWETEFRQFDYIGAPWPWHDPKHQVGNGGFSLRSRRLLNATADPEFPSDHPEDDLIGRRWRPWLEKRGIKFADVATARRFSVERDRSEAPSFGFHGMFNFWRALSPETLEELLERVTPAVAGSVEAFDLILEYVLRGRWYEARAALKRYERQRGTEATVASLSVVAQSGAGLALRDAIVRYGTRQ